MGNRKSIDALSIGVICVAISIAVLSIWNLPPKWEKTLYARVGQVLAEEAIAAAGPNGEIVLIARDTEPYPQPAMETAVREIEKALDRAGLALTKKLIALDPLRPVEVPPGDFYEAIRRAKPGQVIVSLLGPPVLEPEQKGKLPSVRPKIIALCTGSMAEHAGLSDLFQQGLLQAAVVNRQNPGGAVSGKGGFDELYEVVRSDNLKFLTPAQKL